MRKTSVTQKKILPNSLTQIQIQTTEKCMGVKCGLLVCLLYSG